MHDLAPFVHDHAGSCMIMHDLDEFDQDLDHDLGKIS